MGKPIFCIVAIVLAGCAEWRGLRIDGSSVTAFDESIRRLEQELPSEYHRQLFVLALGDVALENNVIGRGDEAYRAQLHGLTYNSVIALADESGTPVASRYSSERRYVDVLEEQLRLQRLAEKTAPRFSFSSGSGN
jgi:hypothetical protein